MAITIINPNLIVAVTMFLLAFTGQTYVNGTSPTQRSACANIAQLTDPQIQGFATAACAGTDLARVIIADKLRNSQFVFAAVGRTDGRYNVAIQWELSSTPNDPQCNLSDLPNFPQNDLGQNYYMTAQFEHPTRDGKYMQVNQKCILATVSAGEIMQRIIQRLAEKGLSLDDVPWDTVNRMTVTILTEIAQGILGQ